LKLRKVEVIKLGNQGRDVQSVPDREFPRVRVEVPVMAPAQWNAGKITGLLPYAMRAGVARVHVPA
jgi:hypothetical protein